MSIGRRHRLHCTSPATPGCHDPVAVCSTNPCTFSSATCAPSHVMKDSHHLQSSVLCSLSITG